MEPLGNLEDGAVQRMSGCILEGIGTRLLAGAGSSSSHVLLAGILKEVSKNRRP